MSKTISEIINDIVDSGISIDDVVKAWGSRENKLFQSNITSTCKALKNKFIEEYVGKYLIVDNSNIEIKKDFTYNIDTTDLYPSIKCKIVKVTGIHVHYNSIYIIEFSGDCFDLDIFGVDSDFPEDRLEYFKSSLCYMNKYYSEGKINICVDNSGNITNNPHRFKCINSSLVIELLDYYKKSYEYSLGIIKSRLGI